MGGLGNCRPDFLVGGGLLEIVVAEAVPLPAVFEAGCFPFAAVFEAACVGSEAEVSGTVLYGGLGTLSGLSICICIDIISSNCLSIHINDQCYYDLSHGWGIRTRLDSGVNESTVLLPLNAYSSRVLPISGMRFIHFVQSPQTETVRRFGDILAEGPPYGLCASDPSFTSPICTFGVDVNWVHARPSKRVP